jgi:hypothetical protein
MASQQVVAAWLPVFGQEGKLPHPDDAIIARLA